MRVTFSRVGFGSLGTGGALGYGDFLTGGRVMVQHDYDWSLSAHAPSDVTMELSEPTSVRGSMSASATGKAEFWIDDHMVVALDEPCQATPEIRLPPGNYRLRCLVAGKHDGAHTVWTGCKCDSLVGKVALCAIACYRERVVTHEARLHASAAKQGWLCHTFGVGRGYAGHYQEKTCSMVRWIESLPENYTHVLYMDARDTLLLADEGEVLSKVSAHPVTVSMEACCWPEHTEEWASAFREAAGVSVSGTDPNQYQRATNEGGAPVLAYINAGMFAGERGALLEHLRNLKKFQEDRSTNRCPEWLKKYNRAGSYHNTCDQFLWQAYYMEIAGCVHLDTDAELFCNMSCQHLELTSPHLEKVGDRVETRYGTRPPCLHFSGWGLPYMKNWANWLSR